MNISLLVEFNPALWTEDVFRGGLKGRDLIRPNDLCSLRSISRGLIKGGTMRDLIRAQQEMQAKIKELGDCL